jgi:PAS domain S-box-containing protein
MLKGIAKDQGWVYVKGEQAMFHTERLEKNCLLSSSSFLHGLETLPDALFFLDEQQKILYANLAAAEEVGISQQALPGGSFWRCAPHLVSLKLYRALRQTYLTRLPLHVEYYSSIRSIWYHVHLSPTSEGTILLIHAQERHLSPQNMPERHELLPWDVLEKLAANVVLLTPEGTILYINQMPLEIAQYAKAEVVGKAFIEMTWWPDNPAVRDHLCAIIARAARGETVQFETRIRTAQGNYLERAATLTPNLDQEGRVEYLTYTSTDITVQKQAEDELRKLVDTLPQLIWVARPDGYVEYHNQRWLDYTLLPIEWTQGYEWCQCLYPEDRPRVLAIWQAAIQTGEPYETEQRVQNGATGEYRWFLARGAPYKDAQGNVIKWIGTLTDIDDQKRAAQILRDNETQLRVLAETVPQFVWSTRSDGYLEYWNQQYANYLQAAPEAIQGFHWRQFLHPDDYETVIASRARSLETGQPYEIEYRLRNGQTGTYRWFLARGAPARDDSGKIIRWFGTCTDIEEQKRIEESLRKSQEQARELEIRKDNFISMASHELKTPLTSLKLHTQLLKKRLAGQENARMDATLSRMEGQVHRLERLVGELLDVSKMQAGKLEYQYETIELHELLSEIVETMQQMNTTHTIAFYSSSRVALSGDRDRLGQVFTNLLSNAIKYSPSASTVEVEMLTDEERVTVYVRDQGIGIPQEQREKIFERFYRAVAPNEKAFPGLGMGLYIVAEIVKQHGGTITVESQVDKGSIFSVTLPAQRKPVHDQAIDTTTDQVR